MENESNLPGDIIEARASTRERQEIKNPLKELENLITGLASTEQDKVVARHAATAVNKFLGGWRTYFNKHLEVRAAIGSLNPSHFPVDQPWRVYQRGGETLYPLPLAPSNMVDEGGRKIIISAEYQEAILKALGVLQKCKVNDLRELEQLLAAVHSPSVFDRSSRLGFPVNQEDIHAHSLTVPVNVYGLKNVQVRGQEAGVFGGFSREESNRSITGEVDAENLRKLMESPE